MSLKAGSLAFIPFVIPQTELLAGTVIDLVSPVDGYITELGTTVQTVPTTGGTVVVKIGTTAVAGLSNTVANAATKGTRATSTATPGSATRKVAKGDRITLTPAGFATAGAVNGYVAISSADVSPAL